MWVTGVSGSTSAYGQFSNLASICYKDIGKEEYVSHEVWDEHLIRRSALLFAARMNLRQRVSSVALVRVKDSIFEKGCSD